VFFDLCAQLPHHKGSPVILKAYETLLNNFTACACRRIRELGNLQLSFPWGKAVFLVPAHVNRHPFPKRRGHSKDAFRLAILYFCQ
jgi:hypothetical protein